MEVVCFTPGSPQSAFLLRFVGVWQMTWYEGGSLHKHLTLTTAGPIRKKAGTPPQTIGLIYYKMGPFVFPKRDLAEAMRF